jgi:serine/threonine protein kinase
LVLFPRKSPNVLLTGAWEARVADFGLSRLLLGAVSTAAPGTPAWAAPETLAVATRGSQREADTYSFGVVLWEVMAKRSFF